MLAMKDQKGFVGASVPGLARMAAVSLDTCREALKKFESPDPDSRDSNFEGRKIKTVEGGWVILSHERFQKLMTEVSTKIGNAKRQKKFRDMQKNHKPLPGESTYQKAVKAEVTDEQLDKLTDPDRLREEPVNWPVI
jgi:hypothetical protein